MEEKIFKPLNKKKDRFKEMSEKEQEYLSTFPIYIYLVKLIGIMGVDYNVENVKNYFLTNSQAELWRDLKIYKSKGKLKKTNFKIYKIQLLTIKEE